MADVPAYPEYLSPDGKKTQVADTPRREVELKFAGWRKLSEPRQDTGSGAHRRSNRQQDNR